MQAYLTSVWVRPFAFADGREHHAGGGGHRNPDAWVGRDRTTLGSKLRHRLRVDDAFDVWTQRISTWWPRGHSTSGDPDTFVTLEKPCGWAAHFERTPDGTEIDWGEITQMGSPGLARLSRHIAVRDRSK